MPSVIDGGIVECVSLWSIAFVAFGVLCEESVEGLVDGCSS